MSTSSTETTGAWYEDESFWEATTALMFFKDRMAAAGNEVSDLLRLSGVKAPAKVLDLACGLGRHSIELARHGLEVTGLDITQAHLDKAETRASAEGLAIEWVHADMRKFVRPEAFDVVFNLFSSFGYFDDPKDDAEVIRHMHESLKPGGMLVIDLMGKEVLARQFGERDARQVDDLIILAENRVRDAWTWVDCKWSILKDSQVMEYCVSVRPFSALELRALLESCGFKVHGIYGSFQGIPYDHEAQRLVMIARK